MYYCKDNNVSYYKYSSESSLVPSRLGIEKIKNIDFWKISTELLSYFFSTFLLAIFIIFGYLNITKQNRIFSQQITYIFSTHSEFDTQKYTTYMVKSQKKLLQKQEIARIDKILTSCNATEGIKPSLGKREEYVRTILVKKGDTLYTLAEKAYGDASYYRLIFDANPKILKSKKDLKIGQVLRIPF